MTINVNKLTVGDVPVQSNGSQNTGKRPVDASRTNLGNSKLRTTLNNLIDQSKLADAQNVKLTGDQTINGRKEFTDIVISGAVLPVTGTEIILNQDSLTEATCKFSCNRGDDGTDASLVYNISTSPNQWEFFRDDSTLSTLRIAAPVNPDHAATKDFVTTLTNGLATDIINLDAAVVKKAGAQTITGKKTFSLPIVGAAAVENNELVTLAQALALAGTGIFIQDTVPDPTLNGVWIRTGQNNNQRLYCSPDGASWFPVTTDVPRGQEASIVSNELDILVKDGNHVFVDVNDDFTLNNLDFSDLTLNEYPIYGVILALKQVGSGGTILGFGGKYRFGEDIIEGDVVLSTTTGAVDYLGLRYNSADDKIDVVAFSKGFQ